MPSLWEAFFKFYLPLNLSYTYLYSKFPTLSIPNSFSCSNSCFSMKLNEFNHCSAFSPFHKNDIQPKSFIQIRDLPKSVKAFEGGNPGSRMSHRQSQRQENDDSDSTHHSHKSPKVQKLTKEEKRRNNLKSIMKLIQSRKADTLQELEQFSDDDVVLQRSPKPISKNSKLSHFRGVSHNGRKWQVMIMGFAKKIYFGGISNEDEASHKYDKYALLMHGLEIRCKS